MSATEPRADHLASQPNVVAQQLQAAPPSGFALEKGTVGYLEGSL
jgi:hypothetical protein